MGISTGRRGSELLSPDTSLLEFREGVRKLWQYWLSRRRRAGRMTWPEFLRPWSDVTHSRKPEWSTACSAAQRHEMTSQMREIRTSGSVGAPGEQSPGATRPMPPHAPPCPPMPPGPHAPRPHAPRTPCPRTWTRRPPGRVHPSWSSDGRAMWPSSTGVSLERIEVEHLRQVLANTSSLG